jgi:hypothetical protein
VVRRRERSWDRLLAEPEEFIEHGGLFVILVHAMAHGYESGIDVDAHIVHVARIEGDRVASLEGYSSERDARSASSLARGRCPRATPYNGQEAADAR